MRNGFVCSSDPAYRCVESRCLTGGSFRRHLARGARIAAMRRAEKRETASAASEFDRMCAEAKAGILKR